MGGPKMTKAEMKHAKAMRAALKDMRMNPNNAELRADAKVRLKAARSGLMGFWHRQATKIDHNGGSDA